MRTSDREQHGARPARPFRPANALILLILFGMFIAYGTLIPFDFSAPPDQVESKLRGFFAKTLQGASRTDLISNVLLFVPWGALLAAWLASKRPAGLVTSVIAAVVSGGALSGLVEMLQLYAPTRISSWLDLAMNTSGSALGAVAGWVAVVVIWPGIEADLRSRSRRRPLAVLTAFAALGLVVSSMAPFDVSLDVGDLKSAVKSARLIPFGSSLDGQTPTAKPWAWTREVVEWSLLGGLCALALREVFCTRPRVLFLSVAFALGLSGLIEVAQLVVASRVSDMTSVVLAGTGGALGAFVVMGDARRTPRGWIVPALILWGIAVTLESWTPPRFVLRSWRDLSWENGVPFLAYYRRTDIYALADIVAQMMSYIPLGFLLATRNRQATGWRVGAIGFGVALVLEAGQFFLEDRYCELTDAISGAAGAILGFALAWELAGSLAREREGGEAAAPARVRPGPAAGNMPASACRSGPVAVSLLAWLDTRTYGVKLVAVSLAVAGVMIGFLLLLRILGLP